MKLLFFYATCCLVLCGLSEAWDLPNGYDACSGGGGGGEQERNATSPGLIATENWPNGTYPPNSFCEWVIRQDDEQVLELKFVNFTLEASEQCKSDYVEVYQGEDDEGEFVGRFCGQTPPSAIIATGNALFMRFVSDESVEYQGFLARYGTPTSTTACTSSRPDIITSEAGSISTDNYPADYLNNQVCSWRFEAEEGETWTLAFADAEIENCCSCDNVQVFDGFDSSAPRRGLWFGTDIRIPVIESSSRYLYVTFDTDFSVTYRGFLAAFRKISAN